MRAVIVQSNYLPWIGFFDLIFRSDIFVFYDDVQYTIRNWRNRNRIRLPQKWIWLTVPVNLKKSYFKYKISEVPISYNLDWQTDHLNKIMAAYAKAPYFDLFFPNLERILKKHHQWLVELNYELLFMICDFLKIKKNFLFSQQMKIPQNLKKTERFLYILENLKVNEYLSGPTAKSYFEVDKLAKKGIKVVWHEYKHPFYRQNLWGTNYFISHLSILDLIFNHGQESRDILMGKKIINRPKEIRFMTPEDYK